MQHPKRMRLVDRYHGKTTREGGSSDQQESHTANTTYMGTIDFWMVNWVLGVLKEEEEWDALKGPTKVSAFLPQQFNQTNL